MPLDEFHPFDATTWVAPVATAGTVKVQGVPVVPGKLPVESVEQFEGIAIPAKLKVMLELAAKPVPLAATVLPIPPRVGLSSMPAGADGGFELVSSRASAGPLDALELVGETQRLQASVAPTMATARSCGDRRGEE